LSCSSLTASFVDLLTLTELDATDFPSKLLTSAVRMSYWYIRLVYLKFFNAQLIGRWE